MMTVLTHSNRLVLRDAPWRFWVLGLLLVVMGAVIMTAVMVISLSEDYPIWVKFLASGAGIGAIGGGIAIIYSHPVSRLMVDAKARTLTILRLGLFRREHEIHPFEEIEKIAVIQRRADNGNPIYSLYMQLFGGREVPLTLLWLIDSGKLEQQAAQLNQAVFHLTS